ncbi:helix-turn-helix transcriptional regulator [Streptomyces sp. NPDC051662]|uniref:helix-turn-helix domain-containing protein n=1 Tax=Streptomyces sp. NPDC051662 TaxID=3154750 RepID=UPI0034302B12
MATSGARANGNRASTVLGRRLGGELLALRVAAGKTQQEAAQILSATATKIVKMERGWVPMRDPDIKALCQLYEVKDPEAVNRMLELAKTDRERRKVKGWWNDTPTIATQVEYIEMEDGAHRVRQWQLALIPGLFQTPEYVRAMCVADMSWDDIDRIEDVVTGRAKRQERLYGEQPLRIHAVIWEGALRQLMGGPEVMSRQLAHLCELAELPNVQIQVLPFRAGAHPCSGGPFNILSFGEDEAVDVVHMDALGSTIWIENAEESAVFATLFDRAARASLSPYDSVRFINSISKGLSK